MTWHRPGLAHRFTPKAASSPKAAPGRSTPRGAKYPARNLRALECERLARLAAALGMGSRWQDGHLNTTKRIVGSAMGIAAEASFESGGKPGKPRALQTDAFVADLLYFCP